MWFNNVPWVYSHEDENWLYITPGIEVSTYDGSKWQKQDSSYISNMGWVWVNKYPFVYSNNEKDWLHINPKNSEMLYAFGAWNNEWSELENYKHDWDKQYAKWILNPEQYGGWELLQVMQWNKKENAPDLLIASQRDQDFNLSPLAGLTHLETLFFGNSQISDISPISKLKNLKTLRLPGKLTDLAPLSNLINLESVSNIAKGSDLSALSGLKNLNELSLSADGFTDLSVLKNFKSLNKLHVYAYDGIDLGPLNSLVGYEEIYINPEQNVDLAPLSGLANLTLDFSSSELSEPPDLSDLANLKRLDLSYNNILNIGRIENLNGLRSLNLESNKVSDLTPISNLKNLEQLTLWNNNISDLSPLFVLTNLKEIYLLYNPITTSQKSMLEKALPNTLIIWPDEIIDDSLETDPYFSAYFENLTNYGGTSVLRDIKDVRDNGLTNLILDGKYINDVSPLHGLNSLKVLSLQDNNISNLSPLTNLASLINLDLAGNPITVTQKKLLETALPNTIVVWPSTIIDDIPWEEKTWDEKLAFWMQDPDQYGGFDAIKEIDQAWKNQSSELDLWGMAINNISPLSELTNLRVLYLHSNRALSDLSPLANLTKLEELTLSNNYIFDLSPLSGLVNLVDLDVSHNRFVSDVSPLFGLKKLKYLDVSYTIPDDQKETLKSALPNTLIGW